MTNATSTSGEILSCAGSLVITGGYNGFSYADIAAEVGIRKPSIHHYFPTKVDLVRTLVSQYRQEAEIGIATIERHASVPVEMLHAYTGFWVTCITDGTAPFCVCAMLASELPLLPPPVAHEVTSQFRALSTWLTSVIDRGVRRGSLQVTTEPRHEAEAFMATVHGAMLAARVRRPRDVRHRRAPAARATLQLDVRRTNHDRRLRLPRSAYQPVDGSASATASRTVNTIVRQRYSIIHQR